MMAAVSITPLPSAFAITTLPALIGVHQACNSQERIAAQFQRIAETIVNAAQNYVYRLQALHGFQVDPPVANREVASSARVNLRYRAR